MICYICHVKPQSVEFYQTDELPSVDARCRLSSGEVVIYAYVKHTDVRGSAKRTWWERACNATFLHARNIDPLAEFLHVDA